MTRQQRREPVWDELVDVERRTVSLRVFTGPEIYQLEQERIFVRCWLYVAHVSQIPQPGDFVINYMGAEPVLVCRDTSGRLRVFINACRHRACASVALMPVTRGPCVSSPSGLWARRKGSSIIGCSGSTRDGWAALTAVRSGNRRCAWWTDR